MGQIFSAAPKEDETPKGETRTEQTTPVLSPTPFTSPALMSSFDINQPLPQMEKMEQMEIVETKILPIERQMEQINISESPKSRKEDDMMEDHPMRQRLEKFIDGTLLPEAHFDYYEKMCWVGVSKQT